MTPTSILLVQHDRQGRESLATILRRSKYKISAVEKATHALNLLEDEKTTFNCLIVVDHLEDMPGQELIGLARAGRPGIKTVMISFNPHDEEEKFVKASGCDVYMPDYSDKNILLKAIERLL